MNRLRTLAAATVEEASGRRHRVDPVRAHTGGPAGNARLTAWTGLVLLVLFLGESITALDVHGLITWHIVLGVVLIPPALLKTGTTGWRIVRYYTKDADYVAAGPPPTLLRLLGPLVILTTLTLLGTGVLLLLIGESNSRESFATLLGHRIDLITLHQASFILWAAATGLHVLARAIPARRHVVGNGHPLPGRRLRALALALVAVLALGAALLLGGTGGAWHQDRPPGVRPGIARPPG